MHNPVIEKQTTLDGNKYTKCPASVPSVNRRLTWLLAYTENPPEVTWMPEEDQYLISLSEQELRSRVQKQLDSIV